MRTLRRPFSAINAIKLHHYLLKPWDPPEENLYPVSWTTCSDDWLGSYHPPPFEGLRVLGSAVVAAKAYELARIPGAQPGFRISGWTWKPPRAIRK
jgi:hypothetical protein